MNIHSENELEGVEGDRKIGDLCVMKFPKGCRTREGLPFWYVQLISC